MPRLVTIVGARPQFIKAFPLSLALRDAGWTEVGVHTGQHFDADMSDVFYDELRIPKPAHRLNVSGCGHGEMTGRMLIELEKILLEERPDAVVVFGDTNSTLAGALAAAKLHMPLAHVEAGLRSFNARMPEEINRIVADRVSDLLLCPTRAAVANLEKERTLKRVVHTGDIMYDAAVLYSEVLGGKPGSSTQAVFPAEYAVATIHRAENTESAERLGRVLDFLQEETRGLPLLMPVHPRTRQAAARWGLSLDLPGFVTLPPLGFGDMARLLRGATTLYTDSGGLQKEAYFYRVPCVTVRDETEWTETIDCGWNRLWTERRYRPRRDIDDYGTGDARCKILNAIEAYLEEHV